MKVFRRCYRLICLLVLLCAGLLAQLLIQPWLGQQGRRAVIRLWSCGLMRACGVRVEAIFHADQHPWVNEDLWPAGAAMPSLADLAPGRMLVANHVSWLDIFAINALAPSAFVAKAEIRQWPVVGWLVAMAGTIFIERGRRKAITGINQQLHARLTSGYPVAFFPEATTHAGPDLKPFHGNLLAPAITEGWPSGSAREAGAGTRSLCSPASTAPSSNARWGRARFWKSAPN